MPQLSCVRVHSKITKFTVWLIALVGTYFIAWTCSYVLTWILRGDTIEFTYYFDYLVAAWTFTGMELPPFMLALSMILFVPMAVLVVVLLKRLRAH